ncbi:AI-2E family transporter [bacterium BMS3Abin03]|nr:AI-2E family transporter [bacterium BMS3Abin03]MCG6960625.1 AI-2E family transporter [bacterium BMS3Abin03]
MLDTTYKKILRILLWTSITFLVIYIFVQLIDLFIILALSVLLAFIFAPFVFMLEQRGFNRLSATLSVFGVMAILIYLGLSVVIPKFSLQMNQLITKLQQFSLTEQLSIIQDWLTRNLPFGDFSNLTTKVEQFFSTQLVNSFESISLVLTSIVSVVAFLVIVPFITFFLIKDSKRIVQGVLQIVPNVYFEMSYWIIKKVSVKLGLFVRAWIFDATFVGTLIGLGFYLIGTPNALPLGVIAGLGHLIPYFGPIIGGIPAIIIAIMAGNFSQIPLIIFVVLGVYTIDNGFFQPYVFGKSVDIHPIIIILLIIAGSQLFGIVGMLLAVPVATVIKTTAKEIYFALKNYKIARV